MDQAAFDAARQDKQALYWLTDMLVQEPPPTWAEVREAVSAVLPLQKGGTSHETGGHFYTTILTEAERAALDNLLVRLPAAVSVPAVVEQEGD